MTMGKLNSKKSKNDMTANKRETTEKGMKPR